MPYNWFYQKRFQATKVGRYFHIKRKKKKKKNTEGVGKKGLKKVYYKIFFAKRFTQS